MERGGGQRKTRTRISRDEGEHSSLSKLFYTHIGLQLVDTYCLY